MQNQAPPSIIGQTCVTLFCGFITHMLNIVGVPKEVGWFFLVITCLHLYRLFHFLYSAWQDEQFIGAAQTPTEIYGQTRKMTVPDAKAAGLKTSNRDGNGIPLGYVGHTPFFYDGPGHISVRAATNAGKTESHSANICFALGAHRNLICTAKGPELAVLAYNFRKNILKQNVIIIDPWRMMAKFGLPSHDFNPIGHLVKLAESNDPELIDTAWRIAETLVPQNAKSDEAFFPVQAKDKIAWDIVYLAIREAETGELCCNLAFLYNIVCGSMADLQEFLYKMSLSDDFEGTVRRAAQRTLKRIEMSPKTAESIFSQAQNSLQIYAPATPLGKNTQYSDFDPHDLKNPDKPTSIFIVTPPDKMITYGPATGVMLEALTDICIKAHSFEPRVTIVADEFANISKGPLPSILPTLYVGRSLGVQLITYVQDAASYKRYGDEASAFTTQSEITMAWAIRSVKDAKEYSERSGQNSVMTENSNIPIHNPDHAQAKYSLGLSEKPVPVMRPDEFLQLPDFTAVLFYKQNPPMILNLLSYRMVRPWCDYAKPMPGAPKTSPLPIKFHL